MSAGALISLGLGAGWAAAWFLQRQEIATYKAKLEHLQEVIIGKLPATTYEPIRFRKEKPVIAGVGLAVIGLIFAAVGVGLIASNLRAISPAQTTNDALKENQNASQDAGPLVWFTNLTMEGGPLTGNNVFTLQFRGLNKSNKGVTIRTAKIISRVDNSVLGLEIAADGALVPITDVAPIPPDAPITLVAKFGPPDPNAPGKILGLDAKTFLDTWRSFAFTIEDDTPRTYNLQYDESSISPFFPNMIGPRVSKKVSEPSKRP
ncbi:hypothetical protein P0R31_25685 [Bradyrhizobium yuanmingense]|uniref:hypothetical protein n=1 Tax=Bradyrhizobium yuanmingense TaxID=108015 RepID=UPI0023B90D81|nr:hypothetical protein [Bradyrhizobium yuanmingense]MDF0520641.1 hypothetical protein [Bradyrhizobium yuanmingense]